MKAKINHRRLRAFTMIEIVIVIAIISIAAVLAVPMFSSAASSQIKSAANIIAADIEYTKSMSVSSQRNYSVVFDITNDSYSIVDSSGNAINHPIRGGSFTVDLGSTLDLDRVDISTAAFDDGNKVTFDYLGSPFNGSGAALNDGQIVLTADEHSINISIEPVTGYVTIQ